MSDLPLTPLGRIIKNSGAERVSEGAKVELSSYLEIEAAEIAKLAIENAEKEGRKTLRKEDISEAYRNL